MSEDRPHMLFEGDEPEREKPRAPKFGEWFTNLVAGDQNPHKHGMYVRRRVSTGRMNRGEWWELTDGKETFWQCNPRNLVRKDGAL